MTDFENYMNAEFAEHSSREDVSPILDPIQSFLESLQPYGDFIVDSGFDREHVVFTVIGVFLMLLICLAICGKWLSE